jgi:putative pyrroloquinoline-quinone-binding quinoprotein
VPPHQGLFEPVIAKGLVYVGSPNGNLYAFGLPWERPGRSEGPPTRGFAGRRALQGFDAYVRSTD